MKRAVIFLVLILFAMTLMSCGGQQEPATHDENLAKLAKVWGFTMYTHQAFLLGERCWDEELLALIPIVRFADEDDVNDILYNWFIGLGDDGYDLYYSTFRSILLRDFPDHHNVILDFFEDTNNHNWVSVNRLHEELWLLATGYEINLRPMADLSWINEQYLGVPLVTVLSRFNKIQVADKEMAPLSPAFFDAIDGRLSVFINKDRFMHMDYSDSNYRLLGLFRLWNAMKYYFPYMDILDFDWNELLLTYIPKMLEGADAFSYETNLISMASKLQDAHILFFRASAMDLINLFYFAEPPEGIVSLVMPEIFESLFGSYFAPVVLREAEGHLVVGGVDPTLLRRGDVILRVNGTDINEITEAMLRYLPYPNADKALAYLVRDHLVLRQHSGAAPMEIDVYRFGEALTVYVNVFKGSLRYNWRYGSAILSSHMLLENNIGLINPSMVMPEAFYLNTVLSVFSDIMKEFEEADINGMIVDLRQAPTAIAFLLADYLLAESLHYFTMSSPFWSVPGVFVDYFHQYAGDGQLHALLSRRGDISDVERPVTSFFHHQNVVVLMNEHTQSAAESMVMSLMGGDNVTVMGTSSIGANGNMTFLPLPGGITMTFSGLGVYLPNNGQTQRIGLSPDIYVPRTIAGIRDRRDELMEAAVQFLLEK